MTGHRHSYEPVEWTSTAQDGHEIKTSFLRSGCGEIFDGHKRQRPERINAGGSEAEKRYRLSKAAPGMLAALKVVLWRDEARNGQLRHPGGCVCTQCILRAAIELAEPEMQSLGYFPTAGGPQ